ncbi:competence protein ComJ [Ralstonia pseudosolanacearum]
MAVTIAFEVAYSQLAVFASALPHPFNDWTDRHVSQGFAWRLGSVSFRSMVEASRHSVEINVTDHAGSVSPEAVRVVEVPFEVPADGAVEIGSVIETVPLSLKMGAYLLRCEFLQPASIDGERVRLTFAKKDVPRFAVILADSELSIDGELLTTAQPAAAG